MVDRKCESWRSIGSLAASQCRLLREKHPDPANSGVQVFLPCNNLPPLTDVDVTGSHIEHVARCIQGGAGPGGSSAVQWQDYLLRHGSHSA